MPWWWAAALLTACGDAPTHPKQLSAFPRPCDPFPGQVSSTIPIHRSGTANDALSRCQEKCAHAAGRKALSS